MDRPEWALNPQKWARAIGTVGENGDVRSEYIRIGGKFERGVIDFKAPEEVEELEEPLSAEFDEIVPVTEEELPKITKRIKKNAKPTPKSRPKAVKKTARRK